MKPVALSGLNGDVVDQRFRFPEIKTEFCVNQLRSRHRTGARARQVCHCAIGGSIWITAEVLARR
jgi:hypothetical protein